MYNIVLEMYKPVEMDEEMMLFGAAPWSQRVLKWEVGLWSENLLDTQTTDGKTTELFSLHVED